MPRDKYFRFLFSEEDQQRIDLNSIQVEDVPYSNDPQSGQPYPQSLKLNFKINDPENGAPEIWPLFPGNLTFIADAAASGILPRSSRVELTSSAYATWKKEGMVSISLLEKFSTLNSIRQTFDSHQVIFPKRIWYSPVVLPEKFVLQSLTNDLGSAPLTGAKLLKAKQIISTFLSGDSILKLSVKQSPDLDTVAKHTMPTVKMDADGNVELFISAAFYQNPLDEFDANFDHGINKITRDKRRLNPVHIRNGAVPARLVYRELQATMVNTSGKLADAIFKNWPNAIGYIPFRFTRTWKPVPECSLHFPYQVLKINKSSATAANPILQRLPAHGVFYLKVEPGDDLSEGYFISLSNSTNNEKHTMSWLDGSVNDAWKIKAAKDTITISLTDQPSPADLSIVKLPHIILRRSMAQEMLADVIAGKDPPTLKDLSACTYFSLRRFMRAFIDHRICGGRLFGNSKWSVTKPLIEDVLGAGYLADVFKRQGPDVNLSTEEEVSQHAVKLLGVFKAMFPGPTDQVVIGNPPNDAVIYTQGEMAYRLWQSDAVQFQENKTKRNFSIEHIGHGGPGAVVALGLASYTILKRDSDSYEKFKDDLAGNINDSGNIDPITTDPAHRLNGNLYRMLDGIKPGAILQFWHSASDFVTIKNRAVLPHPNPSRGNYYKIDYGHSPVFLGYIPSTGNPTGIKVIDQTGISKCDIKDDAGIPRLHWLNDPEQLWLAANWNE